LGVVGEHPQLGSRGADFGGRWGEPSWGEPPTVDQLIVDDLLRELLTTESGHSDPYPLYRELNAAGPLHRRGDDGVWYAFGYEACREILLDPRCGCRPYGEDGHRQGGRLQPTMVMHDPPDHARLRRLVSAAFTPPEVDKLRDRIARLVDKALDAMQVKGESDVVADLAYPLPAAVIGELLGLSAGDSAQFRALSDVAAPAPQDGSLAAASSDAARTADARLEASFDYLIDSRRARPASDVLGTLVRMCDVDGTVTHQEVVGTVMLLYIAGVLTTTSFIGNALLALIANPPAAGQIRRDPTLLPAAVEEVLRYDSPVPIVARTVFEPAVVAGRKLEPGDRVVVVLGAGNRDPARFENPDLFNLHRRDNVPLSFGWGVHRCLGAHLARLEGVVALGRMLARFPSIELIGPDPVRLPGLMIRGPATLPVRLG
jgi:cytochrome P450